jgi:hypothetical protein
MLGNAKFGGCLQQAANPDLLQSLPAFKHIKVV